MRDGIGWIDPNGSEEDSLGGFKSAQGKETSTNISKGADLEALLISKLIKYADRHAVAFLAIELASLLVEAVVSFLKVHAGTCIIK